MSDNNEKATVAIVGAGIGGLYLVCELGILGFPLRLHDIDESRLTAIRASGGMTVEGSGLAPVQRVTGVLREAVTGADIVILATGGNFQETVARALAPLLVDGQIILLIQGNTGGALVVRRALDQAGCRAAVDVAEMDNYPYSNWRRGPTAITPIVRKRWLQIGVFPATRTAAVFARLAPLFPTAVAAPTVIHPSFTNANAMLHVANCVGNAAKIERGEKYRFYSEGVTPAVARLYEAINAERVAVARALGADVPTLPDWFARVYGVRGADLVETCRLLTTNADGPYQATGTPTSLEHKFVSEDVPTGLMPMAALGAAVGIATPALDALIRVACTMAGRDFAAEGRSLARLGLAGQNAAGIRRIVEQGFV